MAQASLVGMKMAGHPSIQHREMATSLSFDCSSTLALQ
jgi:hypothetical protein